MSPRPLRSTDRLPPPGPSFRMDSRPRSNGAMILYSLAEDFDCLGEAERGAEVRLRSIECDRAGGSLTEDDFSSICNLAVELVIIAAGKNECDVTKLKDLINQALAFRQKNDEITEMLDKFRLRFLQLDPRDESSSSYAQSNYSKQNQEKIVTMLSCLAQFYLQVSGASQAKILIERVIEIQSKFYAEDDRALADAFHHHGRACKALGDNTTAVDSFSRALNLLELHPEPEDAERISSILYYCGDSFYGLGEHHMARELLEKCWDIERDLWEPGHLQVAITLKLLGKIYNSLTQHQKAVEVLEEAYEIFEEKSEKPDSNLMGTAYELAFAYCALENNLKGAEYFERVLSLQADIHGENSSCLIASLQHLSCVYFALEKHEKCKEIYARLIDIHEQQPEEGRNAALAPILVMYAICHRYMAQYEEAEKLLLRSLKIYQDLGNTAQEADTYRSLSLVDYSADNIDMAIKWGKKAVELSPSNSNLNNLGFYHHVAAVNCKAKHQSEEYADHMKEIESNFSRAMEVDDAEVTGDYSGYTEFAHVLIQHYDFFPSSGYSKISDLLAQSSLTHPTDKKELFYSKTTSSTVVEPVAALFETREGSSVYVSSFYLANYIMVRLNLLAGKAEEFKKSMRNFQRLAGIAAEKDKKFVNNCLSHLKLMIQQQQMKEPLEEEALSQFKATVELLKRANFKEEKKEDMKYSDDSV